MAIQLHTFNTTDEFTALRWDFIKRAEAVKNNPYVDHVGVPTIGVGFNLMGGTIRTLVFQALGWVKDDTRITNVADKASNNAFIDQLTAAVNKTYAKGDTAILQSAIQKILDERAKKLSSYSFINTNMVLAENQMPAIFLLAVPEYQERVRSALGLSVTEWPDESREMIALTSMAYQGTLAGIRRELKTAIANNDRAEAWYLIRYRAQVTGPGDFGRHFAEAQTFGLYDGSNTGAKTPSLEESRKIYQMLTLHRGEILTYETAYGAYGVSNASTRFSLDANDLELAKALDPAKMSILGDLGANANSDIAKAYQTWVVMPGNDPVSFNATNLYFDPGRNSASNTFSANFRAVLNATKYDQNGNEVASNDILIGDSGFITGLMGDKLIGGMGNDLLIGAGGNDFLLGGKGNDVMAGGAGDDLYIIEIGDGDDVIEDKIGKDRIIFHGIIIGDLIKQADGTTYKSADGSLSGQYEGNDFVVTDTVNGGKVTLNADFQEGDFGIRFVDLPVEGLPEAYYVGTEASERFEILDIKRYGLRGTFANGGNDILWGSNDDPATRLNVADGVTYWNDFLQGDAGDDYLYSYTPITTQAAIDNGNTDIAYGGVAGGDWLLGGSGDDVVLAGANDDYIFGGGGNDLLIAGAGNDYINGDWDFNINTATNGGIIDGGFYLTQLPDGDWELAAPAIVVDPLDSGNDEIHAGNGADYVFAGMGNDVVYGEGDNDYLVGESGADTLLGGAGDDKIHGDSSKIAENLHGNDYLDGGDGNDTLQGQGGDDTLYGGAGDDILYGDDTGQLIAGNNYLDGEDGNDTLQGGAGDDTLFGGAGIDTLLGGMGTNYLDGEDGNDTLQSEGAGSTLFGGTGDDNFYATGGDNYLDGEDGNDSLIAEGGNSTLFGGAGDDSLSAADGGNYLDGGDGTNTILSDGGNNTLIGGTGNDTLSSGGGGNYLDGGEGTNLLIGAGGTNTLISGAGHDTLSSTGGGSYLDAGGGNDTLITDSGNNTLYGGAGNDTFSAAGGNNYLDGGEGSNSLWADIGFNTLIAGAGDDTLSAYGGNNTLDGGALFRHTKPVAANDSILLAA